MSDSLKLLILGKVWPEPESSAAGSRMMQLIDLFQSKDWDITFATAANESEFAVDLDEVKIKRVSIRINDSSFDDFVRELNPDVVLFDRFMTEEQFGWRVAEQCPEAVRVLDTEDLHCFRAGRQIALKEGRAFTEEDLLNQHAIREIASIYRCDLSLIISEAEMDILTKVFKIDKSLIMYVPYMLESISDDKIEDWNTFEGRQNFVSIGNFLHEPNWDGIKYVKEEVWPKIRSKLPSAEMHIYGAYPSQKVLELNKPEIGFMIKGRADDAREVLSNARVLLAPLRFGAGLKGKFVEAMLNGTPSVTTNIGAEGINGEYDWPGFISDDPVGLVEKAVELYSNESSWRKAQVAVIDIINNRFQKTNFGYSLIREILDLKIGLKKHRQTNFMGSLISHHSMASTKYMSKWIEEKNK
ncbi:MAG: glycosyltransferase [Balneolaceae bacterium]